MITLDSSEHSTVVSCSVHPWYSELAAGSADGWRKGAAHERRAHSDAGDDRSKQARRNTQQQARRRSGVKRAKA